MMEPPASSCSVSDPRSLEGRSMFFKLRPFSSSSELCGTALNILLAFQVVWGCSTICLAPPPLPSSWEERELAGFQVVICKMVTVNWFVFRCHRWVTCRSHYNHALLHLNFCNSTSFLFEINGVALWVSDFIIVRATFPILSLCQMTWRTPTHLLIKRSAFAPSTERRVRLIC